MQEGRRRGVGAPIDDYLAERLAQWNALADEIALLWTQCWSGKRGRATLDASCKAANRVCFRSTDMTWALADPRPNRPDEAGDQVRALRRSVERLRISLERDSSRRRRVDVNPRTPPNLRLPDTLDAVREDYRRRSDQF
jgi:hypothetical protein